MINEMLVIDAVVHPYDLSAANQVPPYQEQLNAVYAAHRMSFDDAHRAYMLTHDEFFSDLSYEALACAEFVESPVDFAITHSLPCLGFVKGFLNVVSEDAKIINDSGSVAHSLGFKRNMFSTAESPLSAFYDEVMKRVRPG